MKAFMNDIRNIWCAPLFPMLDGSMDAYLAKYNEKYLKNIECPFGFSNRKVTFLEGGAVRYGEGNTIHVFEIYNYSIHIPAVLSRIYGKHKHTRMMQVNLYILTLPSH